MDIVRERRGPSRAAIVGTVAGALALAVVAAIVYLARSTNPGVSVDRSTIVTDVAKRGTFAISVSATGTLVSENVRLVSATEPGVVAAVFVKPGMSVAAGSPIARLDNPDLDAAVTNARSALDAARAQYVSAQEQARASALTQQSNLAGEQAQMQEDLTNAQSLESLHRSGLIADSTYRIAKIRSAQSQRQVQIGRSQVDVDAANQDAKIAAARAQLEQASTDLATRETQLDALVIRSGGAGVVQSVSIEPGSHVDVGSQIASVADQGALKAVLQVPQNQAHDVVIGMPASVDTGNGVTAGRVARIAPSAQNATVAVDITFTRALPSGSRPDVSVDGTIDLARIPDAVSIARPAGVADNTTVNLYVVDAGGSSARKAEVRVGRGSAERVQVLSGLTAGETVIVSDTSSYDGASTLRLH